MSQWAEFASNHPFLVGAAVVLIVLVVLNEVRLRGHAGLGLAMNDSVRMMNRGALVIDVRDPEAFAAGHLEGARNIPIKELPEREAELDKHKAKPVLLVCEHGQLSAKAARGMRTAGFEQAGFLQGGLHGWRGENLPLVKA